MSARSQPHEHSLKKNYGCMHCFDIVIAHISHEISGSLHLLLTFTLDMWLRARCICFYYDHRILLNNATHTCTIIISGI